MIHSYIRIFSTVGGQSAKIVTVSLGGLPNGEKTLKEKCIYCLKNSMSLVFGEFLGKIKEILPCPWFFLFL